MSLKKLALRVAQPFRSLWIKVWNLFDDDFKRMCVMASLHAVLLKCNDTECLKLLKLNAKMHLVRNIDDIRFPTFLAPYLWKGILPIEKINLKSDRYFERVFRMTPCWLLYTDKAKYINEIKQLFLYCAWEKKMQH